MSATSTPLFGMCERAIGAAPGTLRSALSNYEKMDMTPPPGRSYAPWTPKQVRNLNINQVSGDMHPFTCLYRNDGKHAYTIDLGALIATEAGWICRDCNYTQIWAHEAQLKPMPPSHLDL